MIDQSDAADARRYRWLIDATRGGGCLGLSITDWQGNIFTGDDADAAIDDAIYQELAAP